MNLVYSSLGINFNLSKDELNVIVIENEREYYNFLFSLKETYEKIFENVELFSKGEKVDFCKITDVAISPVQISADKKEIQRYAIKTALRDIEINEIDNRIYELIGELLAYIDSLNVLSDYEFEYHDNYNIEDLLKSMSFKFSELQGSFLQKLQDYIKLNIKLLNKKVFIIVGLLSMINEEELELLNEFIKYTDVEIISIESSITKKHCNAIIIDKDICII